MRGGGGWRSFGAYFTPFPGPLSFRALFVSDPIKEI